MVISASKEYRELKARVHRRQTMAAFPPRFENNPDVPWCHFRLLALAEWSSEKLEPPRGCTWVLSPLGVPVEIKNSPNPNWQICHSRQRSGEFSTLQRKHWRTANVRLAAEFFGRVESHSRYIRLLTRHPEVVEHMLRIRPAPGYFTVGLDEAVELARVVHARNLAMDTLKEIQ